MQEVVVPVSFMGCDVEYEKVEHGDESKALVELGKGFQYP